LLVEIPLLTGYSPKRWHHGLNVLLEKLISNYEVEHLCIILLFTADANFNNKWQGRAAMAQAEQLALLLTNNMAAIATKM